MKIMQTFWGIKMRCVGSEECNQNKVSYKGMNVETYPLAQINSLRGKQDSLDSLKWGLAGRRRLE